jgi:thiamine kinase-like enzyme
LIEEKLSYLPIKKVCYNNKKLKTGYICDIDSYKIMYTNGNKEDIIFKISNTDNELSKTAVKLNMYKNEAYFYEKISNLITMIKIPKNHGIINTEDRIGILLEDLFKYPGKFDIDLNNNINILLKVINDIYKVHHAFYYNSKEEVINIMKPLKTVKEITYYAGLVKRRFNKFLEKNSIFIAQKNIKNLININNNFSKILNLLSEFPLSFCHGDVKSPNIFYKNDIEPYFLDWQYIHLNKGVSDLVFLLVESIKFDINLVTIAEKYYYRLLIESGLDYDYNTYLLEFKASLCMFPFFVCVWFNSEDSEKLLDKVFPMRFMKNLLLYYDYYLDDEFFSSL